MDGKCYYTLINVAIYGEPCGPVIEVQDAKAPCRTCSDWRR